MYDHEHEKLFARDSARGNTINNGEYMARSTMMAILGCWVDYTGEAITWEEAMKSTQLLVLIKYPSMAFRLSLPGKDGDTPL